MIRSFLDNDFYKFTMQQCVIRLFPHAYARYRFINRGEHVFPPGFGDALRAAVDQMAGLQLTGSEKEFLRVNCPYLDPVYLDFLQGFCYNPAEVTISQQEGELDVHVEGRWYRSMLWEVPLMALICELYYKLNKLEPVAESEVSERARIKIEKYSKLGVTVAEFGTRRRFSYSVHQAVASALRTFGHGTFAGTSNVHLAMTNRTRPIGTHAHEWFMFHAAIYGFKMANTQALQHWVDVYRGDLGIALADTYTTDEFLGQFDRMFSRLFDGVRHDSGDPLEFANKMIAHYKSMNIDPLSKTIVFSDGLDYEKVERIAEHCRDRIGMSFGIGTSLTNDAGHKPLNIVIKMSETHNGDKRWIPVVKLSDEPNKNTGDLQAIRLAKDVLGI